MSADDDNNIYEGCSRWQIVSINPVSRECTISGLELLGTALPPSVQWYVPVNRSLRSLPMVQMHTLEVKSFAHSTSIIMHPLMPFSPRLRHFRREIGLPFRVHPGLEGSWSDRSNCKSVLPPTHSSRLHYFTKDKYHARESSFFISYWRGAIIDRQLTPIWT